MRQRCADQPGPVAGKTCAADPAGGRSGAGGQPAGQPSGHGYGQIVEFDHGVQVVAEVVAQDASVDVQGGGQACQPRGFRLTGNRSGV